MKIIVGLGNPGSEYEMTRHNVGFLVVDQISNIEKIDDWKEKRSLNSEIAEWIFDEKIFLIKPTTFMNNSGIAVAKVLEYYKLTMNDLLVIHDDMDIEFGDIRIKNGGGTAGHHGLESIVSYLGSEKFLRIRVGIGKRGNNVLSSNKGGKHVVGKFNSEEIKKLPDVIGRVVEAVKCCFRHDLDYCMTEFNKKISDNLLME